MGLRRVWGFIGLLGGIRRGKSGLIDRVIQKAAGLSPPVAFRIIKSK